MGKIVSKVGEAVGSVISGFGEILGLTPETKVPERSYNQNLLTNETAPTSHIGVVYGSRRKAGVRIATIVKGDNREYLYAVYALSHGPVQSISNPRMSDRSLSTSANWFDVNYGLGAHDQDATSLPLVAELGSDWDQVNGKLQGVAFAIVKFTLTEYSPKFSNITFDIKGRLVFDPRKPLDPPKWSENPALCILDYQTDPIYGKKAPYPQGFDVQSYIDAANHFDDVMTTGDAQVSSLTKFTEGNRSRGSVQVDYNLYTEIQAGRTYQVTGFADGAEDFVGILTSKDVEVPNPKIDPRDEEDGDDEDKYLLFFEELDDESRALISSSDNINLSFTGISVRYTCNGNVDTSQTIYDNLLALKTSFNGNVSFLNGISTIIPDKVVAATAHFDGDNITSDIIVNLPDSSTQLNEITGTWFDPEFGYEQMTETVKSEVFLKRDAGRPQPKEVNLPFCNDPALLNRVLTIELNKSRHGGAIQFTTLWDGLDVLVGQVITVSDDELKWNARTLRVIRIGIPDIYNDVSLTCLPFEADDYIESTPNLRRVSQFIDYSSSRDIVIPTNLTVARGMTYDAPVKVAWTPDQHQLYSYFKLEIYIVSRNGEGTIIAYTLVDTVTPIYTTSYLSTHPMSLGVEYEFRLRLITPYGAVSGDYASTSYIHTKLLHPSDIDVSVPSPWSVVAKPVYLAQNSQQLRLDHKWYVAECELDIPDPEDPDTFTVIEAEFADAVLVATSRELNWNGARPNKYYRVWCQAITEFDDSYVVLGAYDDSVPAVWVIGNGKPADVPDTVPEDFGAVGGAMTLRLSSDAQVFHEDVDKVITPDVINLVAHQHNFDSEVVWVTEPPEAVLSGTGLTRTLPKEQLADFESVQVTISSDGISDTLTIVRLKDGTQGITALLTNEAHVVSAGTDGTVTGDLAAAGGEFKLYLGGEDVTADCTFSKVSQTGLVCAISDLEVNKGVYTVTEVVDDSGTAVFRAVYNTTVIEQVYSVSKSKTGKGGVNGFLTNTAHVLPADAEGIVTNYIGAHGEFKVFQDEVNLTSEYAFAKFSGGGLDWENDTKVGIDPSTGVYIVTGDQALPDGVDAGYVTFTATREGFQTLYATFSVSKSKQGSQGGSIQDIVNSINLVWDWVESGEDINTEKHVRKSEASTLTAEIAGVAATTVTIDGVEVNLKDGVTLNAQAISGIRAAVTGGEGDQAAAELVLKATVEDMVVVKARAFLGTTVGTGDNQRVTGIYIEDQNDPDNPELKGTIEFQTSALVLTDEDGLPQLSWNTIDKTWSFVGAVIAGAGSEFDGAYIKELTVDTITIKDKAVSIPLSVEFGSVITSGNTQKSFPILSTGEYVGGGIMFNFAMNGIRTSSSSGNDEYLDLYVKAYKTSGNVLQKTFTYKMGLPTKDMPNTTTCCGVFDDSMLSGIIGESVHLEISVQPRNMGTGDNVTLSGVGYIQYAKK